MADRPEDFPEWALVEETDPVSGQSNIVEPPESYKNSGWTRAQIPPRQWFNWLLRRIYDWLFYLDYEDSEIRREETERYATLITRNWFASEGLDGTYSGASDRLNSVCWGDEGYVTVFIGSSTSRSALSKSGSFWEEGDLSGAHDWHAVGYNAGIGLYAAGALDNVSTTPDGLTWSAPISVSGINIIYLDGITLSDTDYLIAAGLGGSLEPRIAWTTDGATWSSYELGTGLFGIEVAPDGRKDASGRMVALSQAGVRDIRIFGFTDAETYTEIGSFTSADLDGSSIGVTPSIEYDESKDLYVILAVENPGSGEIIRLYTSPDANTWVPRAQFPGGNSEQAKLMYLPGLNTMTVAIAPPGLPRRLYTTTDYENFAISTWSPGGDAGIYSRMAYSPVYKNLVAIRPGATATDTVTLRSL